jgi:ATP-dependent Clp protease ATP-binding subunit ClpB
LRRFIQREVETRIGRALIAGEIGDGTLIEVDAAGDELVIRWHEAGAEEMPAEGEAVAA